MRDGIAAVMLSAMVSVMVLLVAGCARSGTAAPDPTPPSAAPTDGLSLSFAGDECNSVSSAEVAAAIPAGSVQTVLTTPIGCRWTDGPVVVRTWWYRGRSLGDFSADAAAAGATAAALPTSAAPSSSYPCGLVNETFVQKSVGATSGQQTFPGPAVCEWELNAPSGPVDAVFSWFVNGSLEREQRLDTSEGYTVAPVKVARSRAFGVTRPGDTASCGVTATTDSGVVSWWIAGTHVDPCSAAHDLMAATLNLEP